MRLFALSQVAATRNLPAFLVALTYACQALTACARQLDVMDEERGDGNYGSALARCADAVRAAIEVRTRDEREKIDSRSFGAP